MKLYHVETQEDYDALMNELDGQGYYWSNYQGIFDSNEWLVYKSEMVVRANDNKKELSYSNKEFYQSRYPNEEIITYKAKQEGHSMTPEQEREYSEANKITKPSHYQDKNGKDLYQKWYEEHDTQTFRAIMRAIAERYTSRYEKKNGIEDLKKGIYTLERLREYEEREAE
jgi:hypothetical protein